KLDLPPVLVESGRDPPHRSLAHVSIQVIRTDLVARVVLHRLELEVLERGIGIESLETGTREGCNQVVPPRKYFLRQGIHLHVPVPPDEVAVTDDAEKRAP